MQPLPKQPKIHSLHGLRGVMAWWVVVGHISLGMGWRLPLVDNNTLAVDVFIILSGFVIAMLVARKAEPYGVYITRRAFRLFPVYLPALVLSFLLLDVQLVAWQSLAPTNLNLSRISLAGSALGHPFFHAVLHVPLLQGLVPTVVDRTAPFTIIGQAWSISLEWQFYIVAPLLIYSVAAQRWLLTALVMLPLMILAPLFSVAFLGAKILLFGVGIATHFAVMSGHGRKAFAAAGVCAVAAIMKDGMLQIIPLGIWALVIASTFSPVDSWMHLSARVLGSRVFVHMGEVSYSIYLLHMIPLYATIYCCALLGITGAAAHLLIAASTMILTYLGAVASYHLIEKRGIRAGAWIAQRAFPPRRLSREGPVDR